MKTKIVIGIALVLLIIVGALIFAKQNAHSGISLPGITRNVDTSKAYPVHRSDFYASSGGDKASSKITDVTPDELNSVLSEIKSVKDFSLFKEGNTTCFYSLSVEDHPFYVACFADHKIVSYIKSQGPAMTRWYVEGYEYIYKRSALIRSIPDLQSCNADSDCTIEVAGACVPKDNICSGKDSRCDSGYRLPINQKYSFIWGISSYVEDQCVPNNDYAKYENNQYYKSGCVEHLCKTIVVQGDGVHESLKP